MLTQLKTCLMSPGWTAFEKVTLTINLKDTIVMIRKIVLSLCSKVLNQYFGGRKIESYSKFNIKKKVCLITIFYNNNIKTYLFINMTF